jgi:hypothetical protein
MPGAGVVHHINRVGLTGPWRIPVYPGERTFSGSAGMRRFPSLAGFSREFDEPVALPNTGAIYYFDSAANAFRVALGR